MNKVLVIGIGNEDRGDDGAGIAVAKAIENSRLPDVAVRLESGEGLRLLTAWEGFERVILIDALESGSPPGTIHCLNPREHAIPFRIRSSSTHAFGLAQAIAMARSLDRLPPQLVIYGIEGRCFETGKGLSHEVKGAVRPLTQRLKTELQKGGTQPCMNSQSRRL